MINKLMLATFAIVTAACSKAPAPAEAETAPAVAAETAPAPSAEAVIAAAARAPADPLTDRIWVLTPSDGRLGALKIFLSDGTLMQGSCGETYRLSKWRRDEAGKIVWNEDGVDILADVTALDDAALTIGINLVGGEQKIETYAPAATPFACPDLPR
ncbi:MAG: hypothetical protein ACKVS5_12725 [Parvularculaceae bacterium]